MRNIIFISILAFLWVASAAQAATITGWAHTDNISAEISTTYNANDSSLLITVVNTSNANSAYLTGLLFSSSGASLNLKNVNYYSGSVSASPLDVTNNWSLGTPDSALLNAEPIKYFEGINTALYTGNDFLGGNPQLGLQIGSTANFLFEVDGAYQESANDFIARFQSINFPGLTGSDSDFASPVPTPIPGAVWLLGSGLAGIAALRSRFS